MSEPSESEPSCSNKQSKPYENTYGKCVRSSRILNQKTHNTFCMKCFADAEITSDNYELVVTHYLTNGLQDQHICASCNKNLCRIRSTLECSLCSQKFTEVYFKFRDQGIDVSKSIFRMDIFTNTIEGSILCN